MNKILKLTFVLFLICAIVAAVLGGVNELTYRRIEALQAAKTAAAFGAVLESESYTTLDVASQTIVANGQKIKINSISEADNGKGYVVETTFSGAQGSITMACGVGTDLKCTGISIIEHSETSGLGAVAASTSSAGEAFRAQFVGQDESIALSKAGGSIDALAGATITSNAVTNATATSIKCVASLG